MNRWRVVRGAWGSWIVFRGTDPQSVFLTWRKAYDFARQEAAYEGLSILGLEVTA